MTGANSSSDAAGDDAGGLAGRFDVQPAVLDGKTRIIVRRWRSERVIVHGREAHSPIECGGGDSPLVGILDGKHEMQPRVGLFDMHAIRRSEPQHLAHEGVAHITLRLAVAVHMTLVIAHLDHARECDLIDDTHGVRVEADAFIPCLGQFRGQNHEGHAKRRAQALGERVGVYDVTCHVTGRPAMRNGAS